MTVSFTHQQVATKQRTTAGLNDITGLVEFVGSSSSSLSGPFSASDDFEEATTSASVSLSSRVSSASSHMAATQILPPSGTSGSVFCLTTRTLEDMLRASELKDQMAQQMVLEYSASTSVLDTTAEPGSFTPKRTLYPAVGGYGRAPWEIHRPQKILVQLGRRGGIRGSVLDIGCGIGDNALFFATLCPGCTSVTAFDSLDRCIFFARTKATIRGVRSRVDWQVADVLTMEGDCLQDGRTYDMLVDSAVFHIFNDTDRATYVSNLAKLAHPGTILYLLVICEKDPHQLPPRKVRPDEIRGCFSEASGWRVEGIEDTVFETHPNFCGGRREAYLATIVRLG